MSVDTPRAERVEFSPVAAVPLQLPVFSGPLDLLLHLVRKHELSIHDIPIAEICDQYNQHLRAMQELDLELAGEFIWMAAWLVYIKSRSLLPKPSSPNEPDPHEELVERILEYERAQVLAEALHEVHQLRRHMVDVSVEIDLVEETGFDLEAVDLAALANAYLESIDRHRRLNPPPLTVLPLRWTVEEKMNEIYEEVRGEGLVRLLHRLHRAEDDNEVATIVVAALELARLGGVALSQRMPFAEIYLRQGPRDLDPATLGHLFEVVNES